MTLEIVKGQPIVLPDGSMLLPEADTSGSKVVSAETVEEQRLHEEVEQELTEVLDDFGEEDIRSIVKRTLADVSIPFAQMNAIMLVATYTIWGLEDFAIGKLMNVETQNVERIREHDAYDEIYRQLIESFRYAEAATVHGYISSKAKAAAQVVVSTLRSPSGDLRFTAAKDILDRSGFRPADRVEHVHKFDDELKIRYVSDDVTPPTIDLEI